MEIIFFAVVALLVIMRLYQVLGQNRGAPPPFINNGQNQDKNDAFNNSKIIDIKINSHPALTPPMGEDKPYVPPTYAEYGDLAPKIFGIIKYDAAFEPKLFNSQAYSAYETIITAFSTNDKATLKPLLSDKVYAAYDAAMDARQQNGEGKIDIIRLMQPEIKDISLDGKVANIDVLFQSTLTESNAKPHSVKEIWTFERDLGARSPIWKLIAVEQA